MMHAHAWPQRRAKQLETGLFVTPERYLKGAASSNIVQHQRLADQQPVTAYHDSEGFASGSSSIAVPLCCSGSIARTSFALLAASISSIVAIS